MHALRRAFARHRRILAAVFAALAVACALPVVAPPAPPTTDVLVAARDLPGGPLRPGDLVVRAFPPDAVPEGALRSLDLAAGRTLASPVRRGEPITDVRLLGPGLLASHGPDVVATPVRLADAESAELLSAGDVVDVLAASAGWEGAPPTAVPAQTVAGGVTVLSAPRPPDDGPGRPESGALVVLATTADQAARLAAAQANGRLSVAIRPRG